MQQEDELDQLKQRDPKYKTADLACIKAISQATINVELFTIPLYMVSLYSVKGFHQINSQGSDFYQDRWWPGSAPSGVVWDSPACQQFVDNLTTNEKVFNNVYSIFIEEMLHLQLAANMANRLNITPLFTSTALQTPTYGWHCYQQGNTTIPHILDFKDCKDDATIKYHNTVVKLQDVKVELNELNEDQVALFLSIEETSERAKEIIKPQFLEDQQDGSPKYFEQTPFNWFKDTMAESDLPLFGSIGQMYLCYWDYLEIEYTDGTSLLGTLLGDSPQRDQFNQKSDTQAPQYPGIQATFEEQSTQVKLQFINMINAITDQGEGQQVVSNIVKKWANQAWAIQYQRQQKASAESNTVEDKYQPDVAALKKDYPDYNDIGDIITNGISGQAYARIMARNFDHFETFAQVGKLIIDNRGSVGDDKYQTWQDWHKANRQQGNSQPWTKAQLQRGPGNTKYNLPSAEEVATALNNLGQDEQCINAHHTFSQGAVGTIKGLTTTLDKYWSDPNGEFPSPAMSGSGDRVSICWAVTGEVPNLVAGIKAPDPQTLYHACQALNLAGESDKNSCAAVTTYHSCKGSNECKAQGGCGFVHSTTPGGSCGGTVSVGVKSAPADNKCNNLGGCAVPISASQLFPSASDDCDEMQLFKFSDGPEYSFSPIDYINPETKKVEKTMPYNKGDAVYDIAWQAYRQAKGLINADCVESKPPANDIRLALPPST